MTIGILGGGQLARMLILAGYPLGLSFRVLDPDPDCPAAPLAELIVGEYDDDESLTEFSRGVDVVTYEFENVPAHTAQWLTAHVPVFPPANALATAQDRLSEKRLFRELGIGTPEFEPVDTAEQFRAAVARLGLPCVLKTRRFGYDGKGQFVLRAPDDVDRVWTALGAPRGPEAHLILEAFVPFAREVSMLGVRARDGATAIYPVVENVHSHGILSRSIAPAPGLAPAAQAAYETSARRVLERLDHVGVLAIEFFEMPDGSFLANEMAPRVHNSGHWTIEGAECSQFENHIRAVAGLPLGSTESRGDSVMYNIVGAHPPRAELLAIPGVHLHDYGKSARPSRKLGHVTICSANAETLKQAGERVAAILAASGSRP